MRKFISNPISAQYVFNLKSQTYFEEHFFAALLLG